MRLIETLKVGKGEGDLTSLVGVFSLMLLGANRGLFSVDEEGLF